MALIMNNPILTLDFFNGDSVTMQYHPSSLNMSEKSHASSQPGLDSVITFIPPKETSSNAVNVSAYFTALTPAMDEPGVASAVNTDLIAGGAAVLTLNAVTAAGGRVVLDSLDAAGAVISLAKGVYNIATGVVSSEVLNPIPIGLASDHIKKLKILAKAIDEGSECLVSWDLAFEVFPNNSYVLTDMDISVDDIQEETGASMIIKVDLTLIKHGTRIEVL